MGFKNFLREYFAFNRRERNGVFILLAIILGLLLYLAFSDRLFTGNTTDFSIFEKEITAFEAELKSAEDSDAASGKGYVFSGNVLMEGAEYSGSKNGHSPYGKSDRTRGTLLVELNSADTTELKQIRGIGSVFAMRILKFRDALGGFVSKEQLLEVYGFDREKFEQVSPQVVLDTLKINKLNLNTASVEDLDRHPYITKKQAVAIFTSRVKKGDFSKAEEVKNIALMNDSSFVKVAPYLTVQ